MASYQRVALFIFFDSIERDLIEAIRRVSAPDLPEFLTDDERRRALARLQRQDLDIPTPYDVDLLPGLDLGDKFAVLMRLRPRMNNSLADYYVSKQRSFERSISIRNSTMHGRPLTTEDYSIGFALANEFVSTPVYWPTLASVYRQYNDNPEALLSLSVSLLDDESEAEVLNNLPVPDYEDTGFQPRQKLEKELRAKILGRHPVITVLGDGGNGKTALTLQTLYGLVSSNDHNFDAIVWASAKTSILTEKEIVRIEGAITSSLGIFEEVANLLEPSEGSPLERVRRLLAENRILLVIDNLETVLDEKVVDFASDVPGESKLVFTSRVPLGGDLSVHVPEFSDAEALQYLRRLIAAYDIKQLSQSPDSILRKHLSRLANKPLLIKWFAIGVSKGLEPARITADPKNALTFCMENVFERLSDESRRVLATMAVIPQAVSAAILEHIGFLEPPEVEAGLAELTRFGLVERQGASDFERLYRIKPFAKSYLSRALRLLPKDAEEILSRYRSIQATYQEELSGQTRNLYDQRFYTVRSRTEAIAARQLRHASALAVKNRFDEAGEIVASLRISTPDYFEVFRTEAFVASRQGDFAQAVASYEAALETTSSPQPQLHFFFGQFLVKQCGDFAGGKEQLDKALQLDAEQVFVLAEATRVRFFLYDFDSAQHTLDRAWAVGRKGKHDEIVLHDLQCQLYIRTADHFTRAGDSEKALQALSDLHSFLAKLSPELVDERMAEHLLKVVPTLQKLRREEDDELIDSLGKLIRSFAYGAEGSGQSAVRSVARLNEERFGHLKLEGRTDKFGFLRDTFGVDTYLNRNTVSQTMWRDMCQGRTVTYRIRSDAGGKTWAERVALV